MKKGKSVFSRISSHSFVKIVALLNLSCRSQFGKLGDVERPISKNGDYSMNKVARQITKNKSPLEAQTWKSMWDKVQDSTGINQPHIFVQKFQHRFVLVFVGI